MSAPGSESDSLAPRSSSQPYRRGDRIGGKYKLLRLLDEGGMGVVWVAHNLGLDVQVALKFIRPEIDSPAAAERLVREARAAARLDHPAIVRILDVGHSDRGDPFLVMELLEGESLADVLDRELRLDAVTAAQILLPIAGALEAIHAKGMVHRDVKPDNIFLARSDAGTWQPKLVDFGLAKIGERAHLSKITRRGAVVGSPGYIAPELMLGDESDHRVDIWSLAVVLYETMTGESPFDGELNTAEYIRLILREPTPITSFGAGDAELWAILRRGFAEKRKRWTSMRELGKALAAWLYRQGVTQDIARVSLRPGWLDRSEAPDPPSTPVPPRLSPTPARLQRQPKVSPRAMSVTQPALASLAPSVRFAAPDPGEGRPRTEAAPRAALPPKLLDHLAVKIALVLLAASVVFAAGVVVRGRSQRAEPQTAAAPPAPETTPAMAPLPSATPASSASSGAEPLLGASALPGARPPSSGKPGERAPRPVDPAAKLKNPFK